MPAPSQPVNLDPVALAQALIRCPSVTPAEAGALDVVQTALEGLGFACHRLRFASEGQPEIDNLYARIGTGRPHFCFAGHTDVVPVGDAAAWTHPPFSAVIEGGELWGRGAVDMKSGVAAFAAAAARFLGRSGAGFGGSIGLLITGDEEGDAVDGTRRVLDWLAGRGETIDACLVGEPTCRSELGDMMKIGRRGSLNAWLTVHGVQGHAAYPQLADNPVHRLVDLLAGLIARPLDEVTGSGGSGLFEPSSLQVTGIDVGNSATNVIPAQARAMLNIRFNDRHRSATLIEWLRERIAAAGGRIDLTVKVSGESFVTAPGPLTELVAGAVERVTGRRPVPDTGGGTSDARFIRDHCPVVEFGLINRTIHKVDEHAELADLHSLVEIYTEVLDAQFPPQG